MEGGVEPRKGEIEKWGKVGREKQQAINAENFSCRTLLGAWQQGHPKEPWTQRWCPAQSLHLHV